MIWVQTILVCMAQRNQNTDKRHDSLLREGLYLNYYYVLPTCKMTRIALMTGRYPYQKGEYNVVRAALTRGMPSDEETHPHVLRRSA
jgi:arylsulfatase A-like enzyme